MASSATATVFCITELVESILVLLDTKNIIKTRRVCRKFEEVIHNSMQLKRKLFLEAAPASSFVDRSEDQPVITASPVNEHCYAITTINPILGELELFFYHYGIHFGFVIQPLFDKVQKTPQWGAMLVCQPPATEIRMDYDIEMYSNVGQYLGSESFGAKIQREEGVRVRDIVEILQDALKKHRRYYHLVRHLEPSNTAAFIGPRGCKKGSAVLKIDGVVEDGSWLVEWAKKEAWG